MEIQDHIDRLEKIINRDGNQGSDCTAMVNTINELRRTQILQQLVDTIEKWRMNNGSKN